METPGITTKQKPFIRTFAKIGRNDKCPCGSSIKYKKCCLSKYRNKTEESVNVVFEQ